MFFHWWEYGEPLFQWVKNISVYDLEVCTEHQATDVLQANQCSQIPLDMA